MTALAQLLGRLIRERGGYFPTNDKATYDWLEQKVREVEKLVRATIPQYKVGDKVEILDLFGDPHIVKVTKVEETSNGHKRYYTDQASCFGDGTVSRLIK